METPPQISEEETSPTQLRLGARIALGTSALFTLVTLSAIPELAQHSQSLGSDNMNTIMIGPPLAAAGIAAAVALRHLAHIREERRS